MHIFKFKSDEELFEYELGQKFLNFGKLIAYEGKKSRLVSENYAVVSFW